MITEAELYAKNRERYKMAQRAVGGQPGVVPIGDRPGTTSSLHISSWAGTPAGRARAFAIGAFFIFTFVHVAAEARTR